jgi:zinc and cadmium transporter
MEILIQILISVLIVSSISLIGAFLLFFNKKLIDNILLIFVGFATGTMLGAAFLDLLPEALESEAANHILLYTLSGIIAFFVIERIFYWHHYHGKKDIHPFTYLNLIGDGIHNFTDGMAISAAFLINAQIGIATTIAIIFHEIPQEIGDFGILIHGGLSRYKALLYNFISALTAVLGALVAYYLSFYIQNMTPIIASFSAGGFIYIATADLVPELHKERSLKKGIIQLALFILGIALIWLLTITFKEA